MIDISIVMPVYKKEKYLRESIQSILHQTFSSFELICVNDGSPDSCQNILEEFEQVDDRVIVIRNEQNKGAAYSRNIGIAKAVGEYIIILDADDIYEKQMLSLAYNRCKKENLDIVLFDFQKYNEKTGKSMRYTMPLPMKKECASKVFSHSDIEDFSFQLCPTGPWIKMYRRVFLLQNKIYFQDLPNSNDVLFSKVAFMKGNRMGYLEKSLVKYRINAEFQISSNKREAATNFIKAMLEIKEIMDRENLYERNAKSFNTYAFNITLMHFFGAKEEYRKNMYEEIKKGFLVLFGKNNSNAVFLNQYYLYWLDDFRTIPVEQHEQFAVNNAYKYIIIYETFKMEQLKNYINKEKCKVVLWGYGKNGKAFAKEWIQSKNRLDSIVDVNFASFTDDYIMSPDIIKEEKYIILVPTAMFVEDILKFVSNTKNKSVVIDIQSYFTYGFSLKECIF